MSTYLEQLTIRIAEGVGQLPEEERRRHTQYFLAAQKPDGGFGGREGGSDLYYRASPFAAWQCSGNFMARWLRARPHFCNRDWAVRSVVDFFSLIYGGMLLKSTADVDVFASSQADWREQVAAWLETLRRADGGYAKGVEGQASSTYPHSFLVVICLQLLDKLPPESERLLAFLKSQVAEEGGFREIKVGKRAGTNPTAAAIATFKILGLDEDTRLDTIDFLLDMQTDEGGLRANTRIPIADLLSTFTGRQTARRPWRFERYRSGRCGTVCPFAGTRRGWLSCGRGIQQNDVEYSFYGLAASVCLPV